MPIISGGGSGGLPGVTVSGAAAASKALIASSSSAASWAYPPGFEIGYDQITAAVNVIGTTEGTATTLITCAAHTFDGGLVVAWFFAPILTAPTSNSIIIGLFESGTLINRFMAATSPNTLQMALPGTGMVRFTPSAGSHSYVVASWVGSTTGSPNVSAGTGGAGNQSPAYVRFTKV